MPLRVQKHTSHLTKNRFGKPNGFLIPIFNIHDGFIPSEHLPQQVYLTVCEVGEVKGPHLHRKRRGFFTCIRGDVKIVAKTEDGYEEYFSGEHHEFATIEVPPGIPSALQNIGDEAAYILNTPSPAWRVDDQDEYEIVFEGYSFSGSEKE